MARISHPARFTFTFYFLTLVIFHHRVTREIVNICSIFLIPAVIIGWEVAVLAAQAQPKPSQPLPSVPRTHCPKSTTTTITDNVDVPSNRVNTRSPLKVHKGSINFTTVH